MKVFADYFGPGTAWIVPSRRPSGSKRAGAVALYGSAIPCCKLGTTKSGYEMPSGLGHRRAPYVPA